MLRADKIKTGLFGVVGFRQSISDDLINEMLQSSSGLYFQDEHPIVTIDNIKSVAPDFSGKTYPEWDSQTSYVVGDVVKNTDGTLYKAIKDSTNIAVTNTEYWEKYTDFNNWLENKVKASIAKLTQRIFEEKELIKTSKNLLHSEYVINGAFDRSDTLSTDNIVGWEIRPAKGRGVSVHIEKIGFDTTAAGDVTFYIFKSDNPVPVFTKTATISGFTWVDFDYWVDYGAGEGIYLVVDASALPGDIVLSRYDWRQPERGRASTVDLWRNYLYIHPFMAGAFSGELWDITENAYNYTTNYGLNALISVYCDYSGFIIEQKDLFASAISKQFACDIIRELIYNPNSRINRNEATQNREQLMYELDGDPQGRKSGKEYELSRAIKALQLSFEGIDRVCLPAKSKGIKRKVI